jgi:hypothetical protein
MEYPHYIQDMWYSDGTRVIQCINPMCDYAVIYTWYENNGNP